MSWADWLPKWLRPTTPPPDEAGTVGIAPPLVTLALLRVAAPETQAYTLERYVEAINATCDEFDIDTPARIAAFLAQVAHESGGFRYVRELASGSAYEGRADLGNTQFGDGVRFAGRGLIQLTGRANYTAASLALCDDLRLTLAPQLVERPDLAARVSGWYWSIHHLNDLADAGRFEAITRRINGGLNGQVDRINRWERLKDYMGVA
jgi:putative chitinase